MSQQGPQGPQGIYTYDVCWYCSGSAKSKSPETSVRFFKLSDTGLHYGTCSHHGETWEDITSPTGRSSNRVEITREECIMAEVLET